MRTSISTLLALLLFNVVAVFAQPGALDKSFGKGGKVTTGFGSVEEVAGGAAIQADGKIVQAGTIGQTESARGLGIALVRYNRNGTLDNSFNGDGKVMTSIRGYDDGGLDVAIHEDGKIVVGGFSSNSFDRDFAVVRYNTDGTLDKTFSGNGKVTTDFGIYHDACYAAAIQPDGKILAAGYSYQGRYPEFALVRYNKDGSLDKSFDGDGKTTTDIGIYDDGAYSIALQTDGKILVGGTSDGDFALVRYNPDGSLDSSFDGDGKVTIDYSYGVVRSIAIQSNNQIVITGEFWGGDQEKYNFILVRYNTDGSLDSSFGEDGKVIDNGRAYSVAIQPNSKIVVAGESSFNDSTFYDFILLRYNTNGSLDSSFDGDGKVTTDFSSFDAASSIIFTPKGKIVATGKSYRDSATFAVAQYNSYWDVRTATGLYDETSSGCHNLRKAYPHWTDLVEHGATTNFNKYLGMQIQTPLSLGKICGYQSLVYGGNDLREKYTWDGSATKKIVGYLPRNFKFTFTNNNPAEVVGVRLYITTQELNKFVTKFNRRNGTSYKVKDVFIIRYDGVNQDADLKNNSNNRNDYKKTIPKLKYYGFNNEYAYLEFYTKHFSEFQIALSVECKSLETQLNLSSQVKENDALNAGNNILVYPNPAKDIVNIKTNGKAIISLTDQSGKIIITKTIEGSGIINVTALPASLYYLKNNETGETQKVIVAK